MSDKQIRLNRLIISKSDLRQAQKFAEHILKKELHSKKSEQAELIHLAFNTSLIVSYARPFTQARDNDQKRKPLPDDAVRKVLTTEGERKLHSLIIDLRHTAYGHSDITAYALFPEAGKVRPLNIMRDPFFEPIAKEQTAMLVAMIKKWINYIEQERASV